MILVNSHKRCKKYCSMLRNGRNLLLLLLVIAFIILLFSEFSGGEHDKMFSDEFRENYSIYALDLPKELDFAGERVPLEYFDVKESLDQELLINTYWQSHTLLLIKRSYRYFPVIEKILEEYNVPEDFKYLALAESDLQNLVSPAGATGIWQLMKSTAKDYGLEVNNEIDERYHLEKSTRVAAEYLLKAKDKFGSWTMAAASYNVGRTGLIRQINRQKEDYYYDLLLNIETGRYIYRILALKMIIEEPEKYGFNYRKKDLYHPIPVDTVYVDTAVSSFADFADIYSINYKMLKYFNPWLRESYLTNRKEKKYEILIPREGSRCLDSIMSQKKAISKS